VDYELEVVVVQLTPPGSSCSIIFGTGITSAAAAGPAPDHTSYGSFASFSEPDGNGWSSRRSPPASLADDPGSKLVIAPTAAPDRRRTQMRATYDSAADLAEALRRAAAAHGEHEQRTGGQRDENWPDWYAAYMVAEQAGTELPT
jgi:hypothetical protein